MLLFTSSWVSKLVLLSEMLAIYKLAGLEYSVGLFTPSIGALIVSSPILVINSLLLFLAIKLSKAL